MSEVEEGAPQGAAASAGAVLRQAREQAGLHIGALAVSLKVPVKKLEALEADRLDLLPDAVFARALAASVCRTLKLDPDQVLRLLPEQAKPRLQMDARLGNAAFDTPVMGWRLPLLSRLCRPVGITAGLLLLGAAVLLFLPALQNLAGAPEAAGTGSAAAGAPGTVVAPVPPATETAPANDAPAISAQPAAVAVDASAPVVAAVGAAAGAEVAPKQTPAEVAGGVVVFKARGSSWVEVTDAAGVVQLRKTMGSGETSSASGALPLSVVVGRVDSTEVTVRGKIFDLAPVARDNVARFQIK